MTEIYIYKGEAAEPHYVYTSDMDPEIVSENDNGFTVSYLGENEEGEVSDCLCDYTNEYSYEIHDVSGHFKTIECPSCHKPLIRLGLYQPGVYEFWCNDCDIDVVITTNENSKIMDKGE